MKNKKLRIAIIGIRGIPVPYSGFETTAEQISTRLAKKGYSVTVYCRNSYVDSNIKNYKGVPLVAIPSPRSKNFESIIHSFLCTVHALFFTRYDLILYLGVGNTPMSFLPRLFGVTTIVNINGLDWQRKKWSFIGKIYLRFSEWSSQYLPTITMTDTSFTQQYYQDTYRKVIPYITNGYIQVESSANVLQRYGLKKKEYIVWMGRIVPDNNLEELLFAFKEIKTEKKLVIIGDDHYDQRYKDKINKLLEEDTRIICTGFIPQKEGLQLMKDAALYVETKRSGGAHPSLIEALGLGCLVVANDHATTKSIAVDGCIYYSYKDPVVDLRSKLREYRNKDIKKIKFRRTELFSWDSIADQYMRLFRSTLNNNL